MITLLTVSEIAAISLRTHVARSAMGIIETADYRPIDAVASALVSAWTAAVRLNPHHFPTFGFCGTLTHAPVPDGFRHIYPEAKRDGWAEPVRFDIQGIAYGETQLLFLTRLKDHDVLPGMTSCAPRVFGVDPVRPHLINRRNLDILRLEAIVIAIPGLVANMEARELSKAVPDPQRDSHTRKL